MFQVTEKYKCKNIYDVYDCKFDADTNQLMFLFYNNGWTYMPADDYIPIVHI